MHRYALLLCLLLSLAGTIRADGADNLRPRYHTSTILPEDTTTWTGRMQRQVDSLAQLPLFETTQLGLYIHDLTTGRDLVCINHRQRMRPASNQKVVTAVAALHHLGGGYQYRTQMLLTGSVADSTLLGDVYFIGGMDPMLSHGEVERMAQALHEAGVDSVAGIVGLDLSMKDADDWGWGWCWDDDATPLRPLMVEKRDQFTATFLQGLAAVGVRGVSVDRVVQAPCPREARLFCEVTHTVDEALQRMMKKSDNYYAESMFYQLAAMGGRRGAGRKEGAAQVNSLIRQLGLDPADYQVADGSGLSLYNYLSPELLVTLLRYAWQQERIRQSLYPALPVAGVDGTLEKRMRRTAAEGNVHAKTGTVNGVSSLSGYATTPEGHVLAFSIINQGVPQAQLARNWQDRVCEVLCKP